ncbi:MAG TPA: copper resistance protein CopC [Candidatus Limnocylindrales bacterium]|nr:copper resistance protein CopC [Candidatus Limnocylindrales bacterium]
MRPPRGWRLAGAISLLVLLAGPALPGAAGGRVLAHAQLVASSPGSGTTVPEAPAEIRLVFSEPLEARVSSVDIADLQGSPVVSRAGEIDPEDPFALVVTDAPLKVGGIYLVTWRTVSAADGHSAEGFFYFGVGDVPGTLAGGPGGMVHTATDPVDVIGRWLTYVGILLALGVSVFHRVVIRRGPMPRTLVRTLSLLLVASAVATVVVAGAAGIEAGSLLDYLLSGRNGPLQLARAAVAAAGAAALLLVPARLAGGVAAATGLGGIVLLVAAGHASALPTPVPTVAQAVHVAGAAVWIGGIVSLLVLAVRPALMVDGPPPGMRSLVPRFSALALASIGLVALTGVYQAHAQTGVLLDTGTEYGRTLLMKSAFALGALALGGLNYLDGGRMIGWLGSFRSRITVEVLLATTVLVLTAALAITPPVDEPTGVDIQPIPDAFGVVAPGMSMEVIPGRPGVNRIVVTTTDALAASSTLELGLDDLDAGTTTRVPLVLETMPGMSHGSGATGIEHATEDGTVAWTADSIVLPAGSSWDTSVRILNAAGDTEISRQRFAFSVSETAIDEGRTFTAITPATVVAALLVLGGALALGLGIGGASLPRCEVVASRIALLGGGGVAVVVGAAIGATRLLG